MHRLHRLMIAAALAFAFTQLPSAAQAQDVKQILLTEKQMASFVAAYKEMAAIAEKMQNADPDKPDPKLEAELEDIAKKHGFVNFTEYDDVAINIDMIWAGLDPQTKEFTEPDDAIKQEIAQVQADRSIPVAERREMLRELNEALKTAQPVQHRANIELVKKYYDKIEAAAMQ